MKKLLTVIIPIYQTEEYLSACIDSVLKTTDSDKTEILLINDGSTDSSAEICKGYASTNNNIRFIDKVNEGVSATRNLGLKEATGKYILFLDSDDLLYEDFFNDTLKVLSESNLEMIIFEYGDLLNDFPVVSGNKSHRTLIFSELNDNIYLSGIDTLKNSIIHKSALNSVCSIAYLREFLQNNNFLFDTSLKSSEDMDFVTKTLIKAKTVGFIDTMSILYRRMRIGSATQTMNTEKILNDLTVRKKWYDYFKDNEFFSKCYANQFVYFLNKFYNSKGNASSDKLLLLVRSAKSLFNTASSKRALLYRFIFKFCGYRLGGKIIQLIKV